jgi:DNA-directed RNA polymerase specialized sigma24 family protein
MTSNPDATPLERLIVEHREELLRFVRRRAGGALLRLETAEDLAQAVCAHALAHGAGAASAGPIQPGWLFRVAEHYLSDRRDHWSTLKRMGGEVLRTSYAEDPSQDFGAVRELASSVTGPSTFAVRREMLHLATLALDMLLPRDRDLVDGFCRGESLEEQAQVLGGNAVAAAKARSRAMERFRRCFQLVQRSRGAR